MATGRNYKSELAQMMRELDAEVKKRSEKVARRLLRILVELMRTPKHGRIYRVPGTKKKYRASAPGETPASATGLLRKSFRYRVIKRGDAHYEIQIGTIIQHPYPEYLELGTRYMAARPMFSVALMKLREEIVMDWSK